MSGVALCLSAQGRRNGEALVLLESSAHRDMALRYEERTFLMSTTVYVVYAKYVQTRGEIFMKQNYPTWHDLLLFLFSCKSPNGFIVIFSIFKSCSKGEIL